LVEQRTENARVLGSIPSFATTFKPRFRRGFLLSGDRDACEQAQALRWIMGATHLSRMHASSPGAGFPLHFGLSSEQEEALRVGVAVLTGETGETLFSGFPRTGEAGGFELFASGDWLVGCLLEPLESDLGAQTENVYLRLLGICQERGRSPARIWNYVPAINENTVEGLEAYRVFCRGRAQAFEHAGWSGPVPAASAVGGAPGMLAVMFAASRAVPRAHENPDQIPAYEYPREHGPRSPSFSRAMDVAADGHQWVFISGTAAIKGHETIAPNDLAGQIACTLDNLGIISRACGLGDDLGASRQCERHFKVYLRHAQDLVAAQAGLVDQLFRTGDRVVWLQADICRRALVIEIEATVIA
jgi:chorismate lyase / 3-hydroxybenzoate synthase